MGKPYGPLLFILLGGLGISTMVNAPSILVGYGLVFAVMYYAILTYPPGRAALYFLAAHAVALPILILTKSIFTVVAVASLLLRTPVVYLLARVRDKLRPLGLALALSAVEELLALTIAILYYGDDGIHAGLAVYGVFLAPFTYTVYKYSVVERDPVGVLASIGLLAGYWIGGYAFLSLPLISSTLAGLALLYLAPKRIPRAPAAAASLALLAAGLLLGGTPLAYNAKAALYPFNPDSWGDGRWRQTHPGECPAAVNVFTDTHQPERLRIIDTCVTAEGVVEPNPFIAGDGDYCFDLKVSDKSLLTTGSMVLRRGAIHVEVVPADHFKVLGPVGGGVCPGDVVRVTGVFVIDTDHGLWSELHPAYRIIVIERAGNQTWPDCIRGVMHGGD